MAKHYAIADIHGMYNIYEQVCEMLNPDDIISLEVTKISQHQYFKAIKQDKQDLDFFD